MKPVRRVLFLGWALAGCSALPLAPSAEPFARSALTDRAAAWALECGTVAGLAPVRSLGSVRLYLAELGGDSADVAPGPWITVRAGLEGYEQVWAHAYLHALFGIHGHPEPFHRCGLFPI